MPGTRQRRGREPRPVYTDVTQLEGPAAPTVHMWRVGDVYARTANVLVLALVVASLLLSWVLRDVLGPGGLLLMASALLMAMLSLNRFTVRFAYTRWWRPAYR